MNEGLVYIGKVISLDVVPNSDFICCATVVCGTGGKWRGVVKRGDFMVGSFCIVYLPDSIIPESDEIRFMEKHKWRVRMCKFRGCPSEVLIMPFKKDMSPSIQIGMDITAHEGVTKYFKPIPVEMQGEAIGDFPSFIPKTDEPNYQTIPEVVQSLVGHPYYITQKMDGMSSTAYKYKGKFGVCKRNYELKKDENNVFWKIAIEHDLEKILPEGYAIQWETCGPNIQSNIMGLDKVTGFAFNIFDIQEHKRFSFHEYMDLLDILNFPTCALLACGQEFTEDIMQRHAQNLKYDNGKPHEGVVVRSQEPINGQHISFKCINLNYEN